MRVSVHSSARLELLEAVRWYEERRADLGAELEAEINRIVDAIAERPALWPRSQIHADVRRALVSRFPFAIFYLHRGTGVIIVAFAHTSRRPGYWLERLTKQ